MDSFVRKSGLDRKPVSVPSELGVIGAIILLCCWAMVVGTMELRAAPTGGNVAAGSTDIASTPDNTTIRQTSQRAIIRWHAFSVGQSEAVIFAQPESGAAVLNRVTGGGGASRIDGALRADEKVYRVNPQR
jgi:large exoprotein involved in heme utilization and adhesion